MKYEKTIDKDIEDIPRSLIHSTQYKIPLLEKTKISLDLEFPLEQRQISPVQSKNSIQNLCFKKCLFTGSLRIKSYEGLLIFDNCIFQEKIDFTNSVIQNKIRFRDCTFEEETIFDNTTFENLADFWKSTFWKKTIFYKVDFLSTTVFSAATFCENTLFTYSLIDKLLLLRRTKFKKGLDLSLANIPGTVNLYDIDLNNFDSKFEIPGPYEFEDEVRESATIFSKNKRETFRFIKHNFFINNDSVSSQKFSLLESITHRKETWHKLLNNFKWKDLWDYILLFLNRASNKHTTSYIRGFGFTILFGLFAFFFVAWSSKSYEPADNFQHFNLGLAVSHFVQFLTPTHKFDYIEENPPGQFYFLDFLGRIIIAYGIYQTIQAFRKFR